MPNGTMHGPYARQIVNGRLKFWFAFVEDTLVVRRYEVIFSRDHRSGQARHRPTRGPKSNHFSAFHEYRLPGDLSEYPSARCGKGESIADTARSLLTGQDVADVVRLTLTGEMPRAIEQKGTPA